MALVALVSWARNRLLAWRARAAEESDGPLNDGRTVVRGTVELARGAPHAVRVEVEQLGNEYTHKGQWRHRWTEIDRRTMTHPFYVRDARGNRVRVEPSADVHIIDDLDEVVRVREDVRVRAASITAGEEVYVFGVLGRGTDPELPGGYREKGLGPVLSSPGNKSMLISSTSPARRFRARSFLHGLWAVGFAIALAVLQLVTSLHTVRLLDGETATAAVVSKRTYTTKGSKGKVYHHYELKVRSPGGATFTDDVEYDDWLPVKDGDGIAIVQVPGKRDYEILGDRPTVHVALALVPLVLNGLLVLAYWLSRQALRPWYERKVEDQGSGRLSNEAPGMEPAIPQ
jgi:hypothetical protein